MNAIDYWKNKMTTYKALQKIDTLTKGELIHFIQLMDTEIAYYEQVIKNYPPERMEKYGIPYMKKLEEQKQKFVDKLNLWTSKI